MNEIRDHRTGDKVFFKDLNIGDCFMHDGDLYMKIPYSDSYCCVDLRTGFCRTSYTPIYLEKVEPVKVVMHVSSKE